eukprot:gene12998-14251_t
MTVLVKNKFTLEPSKKVQPSIRSSKTVLHRYVQMAPKPVVQEIEHTGMLFVGKYDPYDRAQTVGTVARNLSSAIMQFLFVLLVLSQFYYGATESQVAGEKQEIEGFNQFHQHDRSDIVDPLILQSIKQKHFQQFSFNSSSTCKAMDFKEGKELPCTFNGADCPIEIVEHEFVYKYVRSSDVVLELGARYGTTTCAIACTLKNSGKVVAVEPDHVSDVPFVVVDQGYGTRTFTQPNATKEVITASSSHMMLHQLHKVMDMQFTVLLIDCEGCITHLLSDNLQRLSHLLRHVRVILLEGDMGTKAPDCSKDCVDYDIWKKTFMGIGFAVVEETTDPRFTFINHYVFVRKE